MNFKYLHEISSHMCCTKKPTERKQCASACVRCFGFYFGFTYLEKFPIRLKQGI